MNREELRLYLSQQAEKTAERIKIEMADPKLRQEKNDKMRRIRQEAAIAVYNLMRGQYDAYDNIRYKRFRG